MISRKLLKTYNFKSKEDYFAMIVNSKVNGQHKQCQEQFNKLSCLEQHDFIEYVFSAVSYTAIQESLMRLFLGKRSKYV